MCYYCFIHKEVKAQRGYITCPSSHSSCVVKSRLEPRKPGRICGPTTMLCCLGGEAGRMGQCLAPR